MMLNGLRGDVLSSDFDRSHAAMIWLSAANQSTLVAIVLARAHGTTYSTRMPTPSSLREEAVQHRDLGARARRMAAHLHQEEIKSDLLAQALELEELAQELESQAAALEVKNE